MILANEIWDLIPCKSGEYLKIYLARRRMNISCKGEKTTEKMKRK
jgi:hypothetical protein